jgi:hypothetical protein
MIVSLYVCCVCAVCVLCVCRCPAGPFLSVVIALTLCFYALSICCAAVASSSAEAGLYYLRTCGLSLLFAGYFETIPNLSAFWTAFTYVSPSRWAFESIMLLMYDEINNADAYLSLFAFDGGKVRKYNNM